MQMNLNSRIRLRVIYIELVLSGITNGLDGNGSKIEPVIVVLHCHMKWRGSLGIKSRIKS